MKEPDIINRPIESLDEPWYNADANEAYDVGCIEALLKKELKSLHQGLSKKPAFFKTITDEETKAKYLCAFASESDCLDWEADPLGNEKLLIAKAELPAGSAAAGMLYSLKLEREGEGKIVSLGDKLEIKLRFTSRMKDAVLDGISDSGESGMLIVDTRAVGTTAWKEQGSVQIQSLPHGSANWTVVDLSQWLIDGEQEVRLRVKGQSSNSTSNSVTATAVKTKLGLIPNMQWAEAVTNVIPLAYFVTGAVAKTLNLLIDGERAVTIPLGATVYTDAPYQCSITDTETDLVKVMTTGVHTVEAWLTVDGSTTQSQHITSRHLVVADGDATPLCVLVNEQASVLSNWTSGKLFSFAVHAPGVDSVPMRCVLTDYSGANTYMEINLGKVATGKAQEVNGMLEVESNNPVINAYLRFYTGDTMIGSTIPIAIDNRKNFAPTADYDFYLNPRKRINGESNPQSIINASNGSYVPSVWTGFNMQSDGWLEDKDKNKCLRVLAGQSIAIDYEAFTDYMGDNHAKSLTIELDIAVRNVTDSDAPILQMCSTRANGQPLGLEVRPGLAQFQTSACSSSTDHDAGFGLDKRTHIAVNILHNFAGTGVNLVRIFVNGCMYREYDWKVADNFIQRVDGVLTSQGIRIGSAGADIDIYNLRVYKKALSAMDVFRNSLSCLPSGADKIRVSYANDILDDSNHISYDKAKQKYQTMCVWLLEGTHLPRYGDDKKGYEVLAPKIVFGQSRNGAMVFEELFYWWLMGQGTSSMSYLAWNLAMNAKSKTGLTAPGASVWIDHLGVVRKGVHALRPEDGDIPSSKNVAKANTASSMQSHKMGGVNSYTDLWRKVIKKNAVNSIPGFENTRVTVKQEEFLGFVQYCRERKNSDGSTAKDELGFVIYDPVGTPEFCGVYTYGPGKGDKPTFGCDTTKLPHYLMLEGCDNGRPLTEHYIPWDDEIEVNGETYDYKGEKQFEVVMGDQSNISKFKENANFVYLNSPHIHYFDGNITALQQADIKRLIPEHLYWVTQTGGGADMFDLFRYDTKTSQWVNAGINKAKLNLATDLGFNPTGDPEETNMRFIAKRVARFRENAWKHYDVPDNLFHECFTLFDCLTDNRTKNTYSYLDHSFDAVTGEVVKDENGQPLIVERAAQDDVDSGKKTDNEGRQNKPYYIEVNDLDAKGSPYFNGHENAKRVLFALAFPAEMREMMKKMMNAMIELGGSVYPGAEKAESALMQFQENYYFRIQRTIPVVAYNETARIRYEAAAPKWDSGEYRPSIHPLAQSLGSQLESELEWARMRTRYMASYAGVGDFAMNGKGSLTFRSVVTTAGTKPVYNIALTPKMWLYPSISVGSSTLFGGGRTLPQRVRPGETAILNGLQSDGNTNIQIHGADYYENIGQFGNQAVGGENFPITGASLLEFDASAMPAEFRPQGVSVSAPMIRKIDLTGKSAVAGVLNVNDHPFIHTLKLKGTKITEVRSNAPGRITTLALPSTIEVLDLRGYELLTNAGLSMEGVGSIKELYWSSETAPKFDIAKLIKQILAVSNNHLEKLHIFGVEWTKVTKEFLLKLAAIPDVKISGTMRMSDSADGDITFADKMKLIDKFGNIDINDPANGLHLLYTPVRADRAYFYGVYNFKEVGDYKLKVTISPLSFNTVIDTRWSIAENDYATLSADGTLSISEIGDATSAPKAIATCVIRQYAIVDGVIDTSTITEMEVTQELRFFEREVKVGDLLFANGMTNDKPIAGMTPVAVAFYINPLDKTQRLWASLKNFNSLYWGLYGRIATSSNPPRVSDSNCVDIAPLRSMGEGFDPYTVFPQGTGEPGGPAFRQVLNDADGNPIPIGRYNKTGEGVPFGYWFTQEIIKHRNIILRDPTMTSAAIGIPLPIPLVSKEGGVTPVDSLNAAMDKAVQLMSTGSQFMGKYKQLYFPAASMCFAYEPTILQEGEELAEGLKAGNWHLPSLSEMKELYKQYAISDADNGPFRVARENRLVEAITDWYWTSYEYNAGYAWSVYSPTYQNFDSKCSAGRVRPILAF